MYPWYVFALLSVAFSVVYGLLRKKMLNDDHDHDPVALASMTFLTVAGIAAIIYVFINPNWQNDLTSLANRTTLAFLALDIALYSLGHLFYWRALKHLPVSEVSILYDLTYVYILVFGVWLGTEPFSWTRVIGGLLIVGSVLLLTFVTNKKRKFHLNRYFSMMMVATLLYAFAGLSDNVIISGQYFSPLFLLILNCALPAILILLLNPRSIRHVQRILTPSIMKDVLIGGIFFTLSIWALLAAYAQGGVTSEVNFVTGSETVLTVIFATIILKERDHIPIKIICAILTTAGILLLI